jgi:hypothetical protein
MKFLIPFISILCCGIFFSCDKIKDPIVKKPEVVGSNFVTKNNAAVSNFKKILLEDYTGMRCPNCPDAATTASNLLAANSTDLVVISVHAGGFAKPFGNFINQDFRTDAGDTWNGTQGFSIPSNPNGIINRTNYASNGLIVLQTKWSSIVDLAKLDPMVVKLDVTTNYDTVVGALNVDVKATFKASCPKLMISIVLIEDGITGLQDNRGVETEDYEFKEMLRGAVNGDWGVPLTTTTKAANDTVGYSFKNFNVKGMKYTKVTPNKNIVVNDKNVTVIVFVYKTDTREVVQAEKIKLR